MTTSPRPYHHGSVRDELLAAGLKALDAGPAREISLRALAKEIGVSHAAPYRHFADQEAFLLELAATCLSSLATVQRAAYDAAQPDSRSRALAIGTSYVTWATTNPFALDLIFDPVVTRADRPSVLHEAITRHQDVLGLATQSILGSAAATSQADPASLTSLGTLLWSCVHGLAELRLAGLVSEQAVRPALEILLDRLS